MTNTGTWIDCQACNGTRVIWEPESYEETLPKLEYKDKVTGG